MSIPPELKPTVYAWLFAFIAPWLRAPAFGAPYGLFEFLVASLMIATFLGCAAIHTPDPYALCQRKLKFWVVALLLPLAAFALYTLWKSSGSTGSESLDELRLNHQVGATEVNAAEFRLFSFLAPIVIILLFESAVRASRIVWCALAFVLFASMVYVQSISFAGRFDGLCALAFVAIAVLMRYHEAIKSIPKPILYASLLALFLFATAANAVYGTLRQRDGFDGRAAAIFHSTGIDFLQGLGVRQVPAEVAITVGQADEYLLRTLAYFGYYLKDDRLGPALGQHQFSIITRRIGFNEGIEYKQTVDDYYMRYGISGNVWATGLREFCIDFKVFGTIIACGLLGWLFGLCRSTFSASWFAGFIAAIIGALFFLSPLSSIFKSIYFQSAFVFGGLFAALDIVSGYMISNFICVPYLEDGFAEPEDVLGDEEDFEA